VGVTAALLLIGGGTAATFLAFAGNDNAARARVNRHQVLAQQAARRKQARTRGFVEKIEDFLVQSSNGRREIVQAIGGTQNSCSTPPDEAARRVESVVRNRQSILDQISALSSPDAASARVANLLGRALQHSIEADRHYRDWMDYVFNYYYSYPQGCPGSPPTNNDFSSAQGEDAAATAAKRRLVEVFNPLAQRFHKRVWSANEI
jgi:hypothetical protein